MTNQSCTISRVTRKRLEAQGYLDFTDAQLKDFRFGIRFAYYLCGLLFLTGLITSSTGVLIIAMVVAFLATIPPYHPFDYLYNYGVRHLVARPKIPPRTSQGRFACGIATVWVGGVILFLNNNLETWAYIAGGVLLAVAGLVSMFDLCIPSLIYNFLFRQQPKIHSPGNVSHEQERIQE